MKTYIKTIATSVCYDAASKILSNYLPCVKIGEETHEGGISFAEVTLKNNEVFRINFTESEFPGATLESSLEEFTSFVLVDKLVKLLQDKKISRFFSQGVDFLKVAKKALAQEEVRIVYGYAGSDCDDLDIFQISFTFKGQAFKGFYYTEDSLEVAISLLTQ